MTTLDGPRVPPASGGPAKQLVILCHGYGANGDDLIGLASVWRALLPDAAFVSPHAPERMEMVLAEQWQQMAVQGFEAYAGNYEGIVKETAERFFESQKAFMRFY